MKFIVCFFLFFSVNSFAGIKIERDKEKYELRVSSATETKLIKGLDWDITPTIGTFIQYDKGDSNVAFIETWRGGNCGTRAYIVLDRKGSNLQLNEMEDCGNWDALDANTIFYKGYTKTLGNSFTDGICGSPNSRSSWIHVPTKLIRLDPTTLKGYRLIDISEYAEHALVLKTFQQYFKFIRKYNDAAKAKTEKERTFCLSLAQGLDDKSLISQLSGMATK